MLHLILDTSIYSRNRDLKSAEFKVIKDLSQKGYVTIHLPYIVENEFKTQIRNHSKNLAKGISENINDLYKNNACKNLPWEKKLEQYRQLNSDQIEEIAEEAISYINEWFDDAKVVRHSIEKDDVTFVFDSYFKGITPFKKEKSREDIPDAFIFKTIINIFKENKNQTIAIIEDKEFRNACTKNDIKNYSSLNNFIRTDDYKKLVENRCIKENYERIVKHIESYFSGDQYLDTYPDIENYIHENNILENISKSLSILKINKFELYSNMKLGDFSYIGAGLFSSYFTIHIQIEYLEETDNIDGKVHFILKSEEVIASGKINAEMAIDLIEGDCENIDKFLDSLIIDIADISGFEFANPEKDEYSTEYNSGAFTEKYVNQNYYVLNTNIKNSKLDHDRMLQGKMAAAFYEPWKYNINKLKKGDVVFLYQSGVGIVAYGYASGEVRVLDHNGNKNQEHNMLLTDFCRLTSAISASEMKYIANKNFNFRVTMFNVDEDSGIQFLEACKTKCTNKV